MILDELDKAIIERLRENARISVRRLAMDLGVAPSTISTRLRRLIREGIIKKFTVILDESALGYPVMALVGVIVNPRYAYNALESIKELGDFVRSIYSVAGRYNFILEIAARDVRDLRNVLSKMGKIEGIVSYETFIVMERVK